MPQGNNGRICVSVCPSSAAGLMPLVKRAAELADLVEVRFDCLPLSEIPKALQLIAHDRPETALIATLRESGQGGKQELPANHRLSFWNWIEPSAFWGADLEEDLIPLSGGWKNRIFSFHDLAGVPRDLEEIFRRLASHHPEIVKLAVSVADACDAIPLWKLLEKAPASGVKLVPIAMGEAGKWTRILGAAFGSPITYASPEAGSETAAGQISASELTNLYRVRAINDETGLYGLLAGDTSYSLSPYLHNPCFRETGLDAVFIPLQTSSVGQFIRRMASPKTREIELNFKGFAVTNPHKRAIMEYLDTIDETARSIGAVNTVKIDGDKLYGSNTDAEAFIEPLKNRIGDLRDARAAVIGAGGAARACLFALSRENVNVCVLARDPGRASELAGEFDAEHAAIPKSGTEALGGFDIIINATPLGTRGPMENASALTAEHFRGAKVAYDLTYNPAETVFLREAKAAGVWTIGGLEMLIRQAEMQFKIWTGGDAPAGKMRENARRKLGQ